MTKSYFDTLGPDGRSSHQPSMGEFVNVIKGILDGKEIPYDKMDSPWDLVRRYAEAESWKAAHTYVVAYHGALARFLKMHTVSYSSIDRHQKQTMNMGVLIAGSDDQLGWDRAWRNASVDGYIVDVHRLGWPTANLDKDNGWCRIEFVGEMSDCAWDGRAGQQYRQAKIALDNPDVIVVVDAGLVEGVYVDPSWMSLNVDIQIADLDNIDNPELLAHARKLAELAEDEDKYINLA